VAGPCAEHLAGKKVSVTLASADSAEAGRLARAVTGEVNVAHLDVRDPAALDALLKPFDAAISLVPAPLHPLIAQSCIRTGKPLVTASYSATLQPFHEQAKQAGIPMLTELGLDPGLDHCEAMRMIDSARQQGGKVTAFTSVCGGLPAPEASDNPLGYRFSWSPRGVLSAATHDALFKRDGKIVSFTAGSVLDHAEPLDVYRGFRFEVLPNRDSLKYGALYGIADDKGEGLDTMYRGTVRYAGWSDVVGGFADLGMLKDSEAKAANWNELIGSLVGTTGGDQASLEAAVRAKLSGGGKRTSEQVDRVLSSLNW
jgi:alpha-aminoadipic semialdehyde synthase